MTEIIENQRPKWTVVLTDCFKQWLSEQDEALQDSVLASLTRLRLFGPNLARPYADTLKNAHYKKMKELRIQHQGKPIRAFFAFDPQRKAIVLCAGNKSNDKQFYTRMLRIAEQEFSNYLHSLENSNE